MNSPAETIASMQAVLELAMRFHPLMVVITQQGETEYTFEIRAAVTDTSLEPIVSVKVDDNAIIALLAMQALTQAGGKGVLVDGDEHGNPDPEALQEFLDRQELKNGTRH